MLLFDKVSKKYDKDIIALEDVYFQVDKGEFTFLVGPSGAGKTTLVKLLIREEVPTSGNILFEDIEVPKLPRKLLPQYRQRLGVVFQDIKLLPTKTLDENISFALEILGKANKEIEETTDYLLELVKLQDRRHLFPRQLSGGEQQRAAIARALANAPDLLVADEPTGNLDPDSAFQILDILKNINKSGTTVLVISHDRDIVNEMKTRVIRMDKGRIVSDTKGDYDAVGKPKPPEPSKIETERKEVKKIKADKTLKGLNKGVVDKLLNARINNIELVLNLTEKDLENLGLTEKEKESLEDFVRKYLNSKEE